MATPHIACEKGDFAPSVLFPGDPDRAAWAARVFLTDARQVTSVRGITGYTGFWKGQAVSIMASGMGGPSAGIYAWELYHSYDVRRIIRTGTAGGLVPDLETGEIVLALTASTDSAWANQYNLAGTFSPAADFDLLERAVKIARERALRFRVGTVFSSDYFSQYNSRGPRASWEPWARMGCLVQDMETYALYSTAARLGKKALSMLTHTDSCVTGHGLDPADRLSALEPMMELALEVACE